MPGTYVPNLALAIRALAVKHFNQRFLDGLILILRFCLCLLVSGYCCEKSTGPSCLIARKNRWFWTSPHLDHYTCFSRKSSIFASSDPGTGGPPNGRAS